MFTAASALLSRFVPIQAISRRDKVVVCLAASLHLATLGLMAATEVDLVSRMIFLLVWALLNFFLANTVSPSIRRSDHIARICRHPDSAFTIQARQTLDDRRLCRCNDH